MPGSDEWKIERREGQRKRANWLAKPLARISPQGWRWGVPVAGLLTACLALGPGSPLSLPGQDSSSEPSFSPGAGPRAETSVEGSYVGPKVCGECHASLAASQVETPMAHAAESVADCDILRKHPRLTVRLGPYAYRITREGNRSIYSVSNGAQTISLPILWAFGVGEAGQTYVLERNGVYIQSHVSFFNDVRALDLTLGAPSSPPRSLDEALGEPMGPTEEKLCFGCHSTAAVRNGQLTIKNMIPGVTCEACHGPGAQHVAAMKAGKLEKTFIRNPGKLNPGDLADFCGTCHRTWLEVQLRHIRGVENVRFQPYRLHNSRCWNPDDARISCLSCHNPHEQLRRDAAFYDSKCLACHLSQRKTEPSEDHPGAACPVSTRNCVTCHLPKNELPGGHFKFADHWIRVSRPGEPYRD